MDVVGVMAAYLPVVRVCNAQSREARRIINCFNVNDARYKHDYSTHLAIPLKSRNIHVNSLSSCNVTVSWHFISSCRNIMANLQLPCQTGKHEKKISASTALGR